MAILRLTPGLVAAAAASVLSACVVAPPVVRTQVRYVQVPTTAPAPVPVIEPPAAVVSVYVDPPLVQPAPIAVEFAPPPMLVQVPPPQPFDEAVWIGGYWGWQGRWVWCSGRWAPPPQPGYVWTHPYYENRDGAVVFVAGFWRAPAVAFVPPPPVRLNLEITPGGVTGVRPIGPPGVFVPPPPGSRMGIVVPAPIGTAPAVVMSAPPVVNVGMRVQANTSIDSHDVTRLNQTTVNNVRNVTNITNVMIVAPPGATASGKAYQGSAPVAAHLAAAQPASVHTPAPPAAVTLPTYTAGHAPSNLPPPQAVRAATPGAARPAPAQAATLPVHATPASAAQGPVSAMVLPAPAAHPVAVGGPAASNAAEISEAARVEDMRARHAAVPAPAPTEQLRAAQQHEQKLLEQKQKAQRQEEEKQREQKEREAKVHREKAKAEPTREEQQRPAQDAR